MTRDAEFTLGFHLGRQTVAIPAKTPLDPFATHRPVTRNCIFDVAGQQMTVMRQPVGKWRSVIEHKLVVAVVPGSARRNRCLECSLAAPGLENLGLQRG